jgi:hypothetical protein
MWMNEMHPWLENNIVLFGSGIHPCWDRRNSCKDDPHGCHSFVFKPRPFDLNGCFKYSYDNIIVDIHRFLKTTISKNCKQMSFSKRPIIGFVNVTTNPSLKEERD